MKHLGSVTDVKGDEIEPVDVVTFGSPCQDLSVAGKRAGLKHEGNGDDETTRSGLFMEAIRIIREMREATDGSYPRFAVWENVPGAFSSNKGKDFRTVLEELIKIAEPNAVMPEVPKRGWAYADHYRGDGWSIAYRVLDAQYWGCAQRRKRIYLVADFRGGRAGEVLFKREGLHGYSAQSGTQRQTAAGNAEDGIGTDDRVRCLTPWDYQAKRVFDGAGLFCTLSSQGIGSSVCLIDSIGGQSERGWESTIAPTLRTIGPPCISYPTVYCLQGNGIDRADTAGCNGKGWREDTGYTLNTIDRPAVAYAVDQGGGKSSCNVTENISPTLTCTNDGTPAVAYCAGNGQLDQAKLSEKVGALNCMHDQQCVMYSQSVGALCARDHKGVSSQYASQDKCVVEKADTRYLVRRLTPTECARLQSFPDEWGHTKKYDEFTDEQYEFWLGVRNTHAAINGRQVRSYTKTAMVNWYNKLHSDSAEYKMWGNGIALPTALYVMQGIKDVLEDGAVC